MRNYEDEENQYNQNNRGNRNNSQQNQNLLFNRTQSRQRFEKLPRDETFLDMLHYNLFPNARWRSFLVLMILFNCLVFFICILFGIQSQGSFLQINQETLKAFGANWPYNVYNDFEIHRWILACILHADFMHIFFNSITTLFLTYLEDVFTSKSIAIIYIGSGITGNIFSSVVSEPNILSVGASTCIMGLLGCYLGYFILNWKGLNTVMPPEEKCITFTIVILMTLLIISSSTPSVSNSVSNIDYNGHFGGIIGGIFLSIIVPQPIYNGNYEKNAKITCSILYSLFMILCLVYFFFVNTY